MVLSVCSGSAQPHVSLPYHSLHHEDQSNAEMVLDLEE